MQTLKRLVLIGAFCVASGGCSSYATASNDPYGNTPPDLSGSWHATKFEFVSVANSATKVDLTSNNAAVTVTITATTFAVTSQGLTVLSGTYTETTATFVFNGMDSGGHAESLTFTLALNGNTLSLTGATTNHNFGSGEVASTLNLTMTKQ